LNVILCLLLPNKVLAVAIATVTSQAISAALVVLRLCRFEGSARLCIRELAFSISTFLQMLRFGIPTAISSLMVPLANLQVVPAINSYGVDAIAGNSAAISILAIVMSFNSGFSVAASTFVGQNLGAGDVNRVKKSIWYLLGLTVLISGSVGVIFYLCGRFCLGIILGFSAKAAIEYGMQRLFFVTLFNFIAAINGVLSNSLQAFGYPLFTSISNIAFTLVFRIIWMQLVYPLKEVFNMIMLCFTVSWTLNTLLYIIFFSFVCYRYVKYGKCKVI
jgi:Na+-driven multidrug efflux pump